MAKFCTNCGNELDDRAIMCPKCGIALDINESVNVHQNPIPSPPKTSATPMINLKDKKVVRYIKQDSITGELALLDKPIEEKIEINDIDFSNIISIVVKTEVKPSNIK